MLLYLVKRNITYKADLVEAARRWVPILVAFMGGVFAVYMMLKGFSRLWKVGMGQAFFVGLICAVGVYYFVRNMLLKREGIENSKSGVNKLFNIPLICAAALLSFAHGSNDVANAIGPLAAIVEVLRTGGAEIARAAPIPMWVMIVGALGLSVGLWLFGARVIRTVGREITELDQMRAYCIAMSATVTVLIASEMGLPVSTTHVCVGAVMGVGFLREYLKTNYARMLDDIKHHHPAGDQAAIDEFMRRFSAASIAERGEMVKALKSKDSAAEMADTHLSKGERKTLRKTYRKELVKRNWVIKIAAAWVITVPCAGVMSAILFYTIKGFMLT